ncbi:MAG: hypothetical protein H3C63_10285 [Candidatus Omnitrophica bacterium]|nr:hypothetical protein [Candidatus Omnitrophota bacterium]
MGAVPDRTGGGLACSNAQLALAIRQPAPVCLLRPVLSGACGCLSIGNGRLTACSSFRPPFTWSPRFERAC